MVYRKPESTLPSMMPLQRNVISRFNQPSRPVFTAASMLQQPLTSTSQISDAQNMYASQGLQAGALKAAQPAQSTADLLRSYGLGVPTAPQAAATPAPLRTARAATGLSGMLPAAGTPEMAGLGAAGRTLMQLGGYQKEPMTFGQILGIGAEKGLEAMQARRDAIAAAEEKEAAAKRQSMLDAITVGEFNIKRRKAAREEADAGQPTKPYEIYDVQTGRKKFVRDVRTKEGGWTTEDVGGVAAEKPAKEGKPSGFVSVYTKDGDFVENVREDSPEADDYADKGFRIVESTAIAGTKDEVGFGLSKADYSKQVVSTFNAEENINRLENIQTRFDDKFLQLGGKIEYGVAIAADYLGKSSPAQKQYIRQVTDWKTSAWDQVNRYIKDITGAQMSEAEARRILRALPNPETSIFTASSPEQYKQALETAIREAKLAVARSKYFLDKGIEPKFTKVDKTELLPKGFDVRYYDEKNERVDIDDMEGILRREIKSLNDKYRDVDAIKRREYIIRDMTSKFGFSGVGA